MHVFESTCLHGIAAVCTSRRTHRRLSPSLPFGDPPPSHCRVNSDVNVGPGASSRISSRSSQSRVPSFATQIVARFICSHDAATHAVLTAAHDAVSCDCTLLTRSAGPRWRCSHAVTRRWTQPPVDEMTDGRGGCRGRITDSRCTIESVDAFLGRATVSGRSTG